MRTKRAKTVPGKTEPGLMLRIRVSPSQKATILAAAKRRGLGLSGYIRMAALELAGKDGAAE
jgi:uncharacterized protein (DUF1778 family)